MAVRQGSTLSASIVSTLKERIIAWHYPPEHRMTEEALCREFGVSRSPVREALRVLVTNGFIRRMPNRGYAVRQVSIRDIEELYDVRMALELYALESVTERGAPQNALATLRETWEAIAHEPDGRKGNELAELDTAFHEALAAFFGNEMLLQQLKSINERLYVFRMIDFDKPDRVESTCLQHVAIIDRIAARDVAGARAALRANVDEGRSIVRATVKEALARAYSIH